MTCLVLASSPAVPTQLQAPGNWSWWRFSARPSFRAHRGACLRSSAASGQLNKLNQQLRRSTSQAMQGGHSRTSLASVVPSLRHPAKKSLPTRPTESFRDSLGDGSGNSFACPAMHGCAAAGAEARGPLRAELHDVPVCTPEIAASAKPHQYPHRSMHKAAEAIGR